MQRLDAVEGNHPQRIAVYTGTGGKSYFGLLSLIAAMRARAIAEGREIQVVMSELHPGISRDELSELAAKLKMHLHIKAPLCAKDKRERSFLDRKREPWRKR